MSGKDKKEENKESLQDLAKTLIFLRHHLQDGLKIEYSLRKIHIICSKLILCRGKITDKDMLDKTFSTFYASNVFLQQQYRECGFKKYSKLISYLLVAEQNNELLMKNHGLRSTSSVPLPEANSIVLPEANAISRQGHGHFFADPNGNIDNLIGGGVVKDID
ncbi:uncharacterized protein LOC111392820 [Olea europaea var. sylvestris]|uniref:uncharacterized protein LOC111392820 n=1 Tax=Olea europaea var. sylvestris TaxID=158386 RepID=UPI000C1CFEE2|nr:uncharacterized protein LOC111392820 [Olea europaea var. sylvestris]